MTLWENINKKVFWMSRHLVSFHEMQNQAFDEKSQNLMRNIKACRYYKPGLKMIWFFYFVLGTELARFPLWTQLLFLDQCALQAVDCVSAYVTFALLGNLWGAVIGTTGKTLVTPRFSCYRNKAFTFKWLPITLGLPWIKYMVAPLNVALAFSSIKANIGLRVVH